LSSRIDVVRDPELPSPKAAAVRRSFSGGGRVAVRDDLRIALSALAFRFFSAALAFVTNVTFPDYQNQHFTMWGSPSPFWDPFVRFDSGWYYAVAHGGYSYVPGGRSNIAYFPAYPLLMRYIGRLFGRSAGSFYLAGIIVSWTAFVLAAVFVYRLARFDMPARRAERVVLLLTIFPFAFFYGVVYTESLFLLATLLTFYAFRTKRWIAGGLSGAVATATRVNGILMLPALAWIAWRGAEDHWRDRAAAAAGLVLTASGVAAYSAFVYQLTNVPGGSHNPFEWAATIERWAYHPGGTPWMLAHFGASLLTHPYAYLAAESTARYDLLNGMAAIAVAASVPFVWRRFGAAYGLFMIANLYLPLSSGQFEGLGRYCATMFPFFLWLATIRSRAAVAAIVVAFATLYTLCLALFTNVYPLF
jgi:hypothetical protein